jgi:uncharacterized protein RhaS with RHS repeats
MKSIFSIFLILIVSVSGFCQITPVANPDALILKNKVKSSTSYFSSESENARLIKKTTYSPEGQILSEYLVSIWDVVSYSYNSTYRYDASGHLIEVLKIQEVLNLFPRDAEYIDSFGNMPVNERIEFEYDEVGQLVKKRTFVFHSNELPDDSTANQTITYQYEDGKLALEESTSPEIRIFNQNYTIEFDYDSAGNLSRKIRKFGTEKPMTRETRFVYDTTGKMIEKLVIDPSVPHNNSHEKFEYDSAGNLINLYLFSKEEEEFELETTYRYDDHGQQISGDRDVQFEYYENGLIESESWSDMKTREVFTFKTQYEYFQAKP